jgi:bifunctional non-homologous end joining protein LigD
VASPQKRIRLEGLPQARARYFEPMKCLLVDQLPEGDEWLYEIKFDGFRALAIKAEERVELLSRNRKDFAQRYPTLAKSLKSLRCKSAVIDGEIVALDETGRSSFQLLQGKDTPFASEPEIFYYLFDLVQLNGKDLTSLPVTARKTLLSELVRKSNNLQLRYSPALPGTAAEIREQMAGLQLEGIIAKKKNSKYEPGRRSGAWVKFKWVAEQEFVIGGYTQPEGSRQYFGALLTGYYEAGQLRFASKVGTGFSSQKLETLHKSLQKLRIESCPFVNLPEPRTMMGRAGITRAEMRRCTWVRPTLVCQIRFTEWTRDGHLRHPSFLGLREDKRASEVVREIPE